VTAMQNEADKIREAEMREHREEQQAIEELSEKESLLLKEIRELRAEVAALGGKRERKKKPAAKPA
jgi:hypothetical protein